jgi:hypothetical protein
VHLREPVGAGRTDTFELDVVRAPDPVELTLEDAAQAFDALVDRAPDAFELLGVGGADPDEGLAVRAAEPLGFLTVRGPERLDLSFERVISTRTISNRSSRSWRSRDTVSAPSGTDTIAPSGSSSWARSSDSSRQRSRTVGCPVSGLLGDPASAKPTTSPASSDGEGVTTEGGGPEISVRGRRRGPSIPYHVRSALFSTGSTTSGRSAWISIASRTRALGDVPIATDRRTAGPPIQRPTLRCSGAGPRAPDPKGAS